MIVYAASRSEFSNDVLSNRIAEKILEAFQKRLRRTTSKSEIDSWKNSFQYVNNALTMANTPATAQVGIEYKVPQTSKRVDFILTGRDEENKEVAVIVELKQWGEAVATSRDAIVESFVGGAMRELLHPSYQAWSYAALLRDFNETIQNESIVLRPCAYLHNCKDGEAIRAEHYKTHIDQAPLFLQHDVEELTTFLNKNVRYGDNSNLLYRIDNGRLKPSKNLADYLTSLLQGNQEFKLIDDQKIVFERALELAAESRAGKKKVLIVEGGPGTGKSVVAINLLVEATARELLSHYVTRNAAPREVYQSMLTGSFTKSHITNLFKGPTVYMDAAPNSMDFLIIDEAHRLNEQGGFYGNQGENQIMEIIRSAKCSVFFLDESQRVTLKDIGEKQEIRKWAEHCGADVLEYELASQFRCNGSDGYLAWIDNTLQIRETANETLEGIDYDFRVFDSPNDLFDQIKEKNEINNKSRMVAGYCWDWKGKKNPEIRDINIPEHSFEKKWNLSEDGSLWILKPDSVDEIGCVHTCQGLELDYVGVIVGPDLVIREGKIVTDPTQRSSQDRTIHGYKKMLKEDEMSTRERLDHIIKNTYKTLMTRGQKGCFFFSVDKETNEYFRSMAQSVTYPMKEEVHYDMVAEENKEYS